MGTKPTGGASFLKPVACQIQGVPAPLAEGTLPTAHVNLHTGDIYTKNVP